MCAQSQLGPPTAPGESLPLAITESDRDDHHNTQAWQLTHLLLSIGRPSSVADLVSRCTHFKASPELVGFLCSIPNSPISLAGNSLYVTLSPGFLSACATYAWSLGLSPDCLTPQVRNFLDWSSVMPNPYVPGRSREIDEEDVVQHMPSPKRIRRDSEEARNPIMDSSTRINNEQTDNLLPMVNESMVETLTALESQALVLSHNQDVHDLVHDATYANTTEQSGNAMVQDPWMGPQTQILGHDILNTSSMDFKPTHYLEESKPELASAPEVGIADESQILKHAVVSTSSVDANHMDCIEENKQIDAKTVEAEDSKQLVVANVDTLDIGDFDNLFEMSVVEIAENMGIVEGNENDKNKIDPCPEAEKKTCFLHSNVVAPSVPSESKLKSINTVPDSEDMLSLSHNPPKREDHDLVIFSAPAGELPLKPSAITGNEVRPPQDLCEPLENRKAATVSHQKQHNNRNKGSQRRKQNQNGIQLKDQKIQDQTKQHTFPDFEPYVIEEEEGSGGYGIVYRAKKKSDGTKVAIKCPHSDAQKQYVINEQRMLERFGGKNFIIKYEGCLKSGNSDCFILEHVEHDRPELLKREIDVYQLQWYGYCMFRALASLHKKDVVHRDVKPGNFLFSRRTNRGYLIDFNLAMDLHQKYLRTDKSKTVSNLSTDQSPKSELPTTSKKHQALATNKSPQTTLAPNSLKKAVGKMRAQNDLSRWDRLNSQGADGSGVSSATTRNNPSGDKKREPLPCHGRKELINFVQKTMSGSSHEVSRPPASMRKRVAALPGKTQKELLYLTPMPLRSNNVPVAGTGLTSKGSAIQKKDGPCAGTKGFRAPEVCLRSSVQGPKIDVWSAGVTLLYLMIGKSPFTGDPEQNMKEIAKLRGSEELWEVAKLHNRESSFPQELYESRYLQPIDLREWCRLNTKRSDFLDAIPQSLFDLVDKCLTVNPRLRISAHHALQHHFFSPVHERLLRHQKQTQTQHMVVADAVAPLSKHNTLS